MDFDRHHGNGILLSHINFCCLDLLNLSMITIFFLVHVLLDLFHCSFMLMIF